MNGSKTNDMTRAEVLAAVRSIPDEKDFVWDGIDEDDRPLTEQELQAAFKATGKGWQTRINEALRDWLNHLNLFRVASIRCANFGRHSMLSM